MQIFQDLIVLTSPPASGKTYWITSLRDALWPKKLLVVSPLRALADECRIRWGESVVVVTPEEWLGKKLYPEVVIFDEFHLFFYWGDTFRPLMWEMFFDVCQKASLTFLLTATLSEEIRKCVSLFECQFDQILWIDRGNQILKYKPYNYMKAPSRKWLMQLIDSEKKGKSVKLIFCQYRREVLELEKLLKEKGFTCISCVGGEAKYMGEKLNETPFPDFIVSTTVLSHGVNLPSITKIFFLYPVQNIDFWIQMTARGGRRGEKFEVFAMEKPFDLPYSPLMNLLRVYRHSLRPYFSLNSFTRF